MTPRNDREYLSPAPGGAGDLGTLLALLCLGSPARPFGAFAWSGGLAGALDLAWVRDGESLGAWLADAAALGLARAELPLLARAFRAAAREDYALLAQWNEWVLAGKGTRETYREEVELGGALARFARDQGLAEGFFREGARAGTPGLPWGHVALFAVLGAALGLKEPEAPALLATFLWSYFENAVAAAAKGVPLGQRESQRALLKLAPTVPGTVRAALEVADGEIGSSLPLLAIASARHEESESRMFRG